MYKNIIFDLYGTLIDIKTDESKNGFWNQMSQIFSYNKAHYTSEELKQCYIEMVKKRLEESKGTQYPDVKVIGILKSLYEKKGVNISEDLLDRTAGMFRIVSTEYIKLYPNVKGVLGTLASRSMRLFVLSNGPKEFSLPELEYLEILNYFDGVYSPSEIGICMPDKDFFEYLVNKEKLRIGECLFVGNDAICDINGANAASIDSVYVHNNQLGDVQKIKSSYEILDGDLTQILKYAT